MFLLFSVYIITVPVDSSKNFLNKFCGFLHFQLLFSVGLGGFPLYGFIYFLVLFPIVQRADGAALSFLLPLRTSGTTEALVVCFVTPFQVLRNHQGSLLAVHCCSSASPGCRMLVGAGCFEDFCNSSCYPQGMLKNYHFVESLGDDAVPDQTLLY